MLFLTRLPVTYNDGTKVPTEELEAIKTRAWQTFGGFTLTGPDEGAWVDSESDKLYQEFSYGLEIAIDQSQIESARKFVRWTGKRLKQKEMILVFRDDPVEFISGLTMLGGLGLRVSFGFDKRLSKSQQQSTRKSEQHEHG